MSSNDQLVIIKNKKMFEVHHNLCVDNEFVPEKPIKRFKTLEAAIRFANKFMQEEAVEYGLYVRI